MKILAQTVSGLRFSSPIIVASSPLTDSVEKIRLAEDNGAGGVSVKFAIHTQLRPGVRKMHWDGQYFFNPSDRRFTLEQGADLMRRAKAAVSLPLFANMAGFGDTPETWVESGKVLAEAGADALELNYACPNLAAPHGHGAPPSANPAVAAGIVAALKAAVAIPVWVKFSGEAIQVPVLVKALAEAGVDGVTAFASPRGVFPIDIENGGAPNIAGLNACSFGGINGPTLRPICNRVAAEAAMAADRPVMGGGGIRDWKHVVESVMFGASLTFMCSKLLTDGFGVIGKINAGLAEFMQRKGYESIDDMRGLALRHVIPPSGLDYAMGPKAKIDPERCIGCGACAAVGSCFAVTLENGRARVDANLCESCGLCASLCPRGAVSF